jgi:cysteine synthase A
MNAMPLPDLNAPLAWENAPPLNTAVLHAAYPALAAFRDRLGDTDLVHVPSRPGAARILAKLEYQNPIGSIKDRTAYALVCDALARHGAVPLSKLRILEYSGGNLASALSFLGHQLGIEMRFVLSSAAPQSLLSCLQERGARVDLVDKDLGFLAVVHQALRIAEAEPEWRLLYQHRNTANMTFHRDTTGAEILRQLAGTVPSAWVASIGSGGSLIGVADALRAAHPRLRVVGVTPAELPYGSEQPPNGLPKYAGSGGMGCGIRQPFVRLYDERIEHRTVSFPRALKGMVEFLNLTGMRIGSSAAANWLTAREIAAEMPPDTSVVTVFPDAGTPEEWKRALS